MNCLIKRLISSPGVLALMIRRNIVFISSHPLIALLMKFVCYRNRNISCDVQWFQNSGPGCRKTWTIVFDRYAYEREANSLPASSPPDWQVNRPCSNVPAGLHGLPFYQNISSAVSRNKHMQKKQNIKPDHPIFELALFWSFPWHGLTSKSSWHPSMILPWIPRCKTAD